MDVELPCRQFDNVLYDNVLYDDVLYDDVLLKFTTHEIRRSFSYAGFPVLVQWPKHGNQLKRPILEPDGDHLLSLLTEGLVEI